MTVAPWREIAGGIELTVRVIPRAARSRIEGAADGAANAATLALVADALGLPRSAVTLAAGGRSRIKRLRLRGADLPARLRALLASGAGGAACLSHPGRSG